jgi:spleen tyrosine kinase
MEAEERIEAAGQSDGLFLVRISIQDQNANKKGTALTISFDQACRHYRISADTRDRVSIEKSSKFNSIMELIDHYYYNQDGLLHKLTTPCLVPGAKAPPNKRVSTSFPGEFHDQEDSVKN